MKSEQEIINEICEHIILKTFKKITFSSNIVKNEKYFKIVLELKRNKNDIYIQCAKYFGTQVQHENISLHSNISEEIKKLLGIGYKQIDIVGYGYNNKILMNKKREYKTIKSTNTNVVNMDEIQIKHDNDRNYIFKQGEIIPWLVALDIMDNDGKVRTKYIKKFKQINKFLELVSTIEKYIPNNGYIIDVGCGKSYLTFALYYYFNEIKSKNISILGLDLKKEVVQECEMLANNFGFSNLHFLNEDIELFNLTKITKRDKVDMVISLHACDTATDYAIFGGIKWKAKVILSVPCCQHEIFTQIQNKKLKPMLAHGILKERFSAMLTDTIRSCYLEAHNYKTKIIEFIETEHTPKNIMIKAILKENINNNEEELNYPIDEKKMIEAVDLCSEFGITPKIQLLLGALNK